VSFGRYLGFIGIRAGSDRRSPGELRSPQISEEKNMTYRASLACFLFVLTACSSSPRTGGPSVQIGRNDVVSEVSAREDAWLSAFQEADFAELERLLAPEFVLAAGRPAATLVTTRSEWFKNAHGGPDELRKIQGHLIRVLPAGENTAIAEVEQLWRGRLYFISDTWVRRDGVWQVVYRHSSPPAEPAPK
jgi:hypothetical protein